jgi:hypothetical protein
LLRSFEGGLSVDDSRRTLGSTIKRVEDVLRENFKLKREIAAEKKRYLDLSSAFVELKN